jgi:hypothetical protein
MEGAIVTAGTDVFLNLGDLLNEEGLTAMDVAGRLTSSALIGGAFSAPFGLFSFKSAVAPLKEKAIKIENENRELVYNPLVPKGVTSQLSELDKGTHAAHSLSEIDRLSKIIPTDGQQSIFWNNQLSLAKTDVKESINEMITDSMPKIHRTTLSKTINEAIETGSYQGLSSTLVKADKIQDSFSAFSTLNSAYARATKKLEITFSKPDELLSPRRAFQSNSRTNELKINVQSTKYLPNLRQAIVHYADEAFNTNREVFSLDISKLRQQGITDAEDSYSAFKDAYFEWSTIQSRIKLGVDGAKDLQKKFEDDYPFISDHFKTESKSYLDSLYLDKLWSYMDLETGDILENPIVHLGDAKKVITKGKKVIAHKTFNGFKTLEDVKKFKGTPEDLLHEIQATQIIYSKHPSAFSESKGIDKRTELEKIFFGDSAYDKDLMVKGKADLVNLIQEKTAYSVDAKSIQNTLGLSDEFLESRGSEVLPEDLETSVERFFKPRGVAIRHNLTRVRTDGELFFDLADSSMQAELQAELRSVAATLLDVKDMKDVFPTIEKGYVDDITFSRLLRDAATIGDYGSIQAHSTYINNVVNELAKNTFESQIKTPLAELSSNILSDPQAQAEYKALRAWYESAGFKVTKDKKGELKEWGDHVWASERAFDEPEEFPHEIFSIKNETVRSYVTMLQDKNRKYVLDKKVDIEHAYGNVPRVNRDALYLPPIKYDAIAYIKATGSALDSHSSKVWRITANSEKELKEKIAKAKAWALDQKLGNWTVLSKEELKTHKELAAVEGEWSWLENSMVDSDVLRKGQYQDLYAHASAKELLEGDLNWFEQQNKTIHHAAIEMYYVDTVSFLESQARATRDNAGLQKSNKGFFTRKNRANKIKDNKYDQVLQQLVGRDASGHSVWKQLNNFTEATAANIANFTRDIYNEMGIGISDKKAKKKLGFKKKDWVKAQESLRTKLNEVGLDLPFDETLQEVYRSAGRIKESDIRRLVAKANIIHSTLMIRMDSADGLMNLLGITTKMSSELTMLKSFVEQADTATKANFEAEFKRLFGNGLIDIDGKKLNFASSFKAVSTAFKRFHSKEAQKDIENWEKYGLYLSDARTVNTIIADISQGSNKIRVPRDLKKHEKILNASLEKTLKFTTAPHRASNAVVQYSALHIMESLGKAAGLEGGALKSYMHSFSRKVNAMTSSTLKPRLFQGSLGMLVSLYQSYVFHTAGAIWRYAGRGRVKPALVMGALNQSFYGLQSQPGFEFINRTIGGSLGNENKEDIYSASATALPKEMSDFVLYGAGGVLLQSNLGVRGNMTPRHATILPTDVQDVPVVNALSNTIGAIYGNTTKFLNGDATLTQAILYSVIDSKLNRPAAGLATAILGASRDRAYSLTQVHNDTFSYGTALRLAGLKPLHEHAVTQWKYRQAAYKRRDHELVKHLGESVRYALEGQPDLFNDPNYLLKLKERHKIAGGSSTNFNRWIKETIVKGTSDMSKRFEHKYRNEADKLRQFQLVSDGTF